MKRFFLRLLTILLFTLAVVLFYIATTFPFKIWLGNVVLFILSCASITQACGNIDKLLGYGKYAKDNDPDLADDE